MSYNGREYERDLAQCRRVLAEREIAGDFDSMAELARKVGVSLSTVSAFFAGRRPGLRQNAVVILRGIGLSFEDVHRELTRDQ